MKLQIPLNTLGLTDAYIGHLALHIIYNRHFIPVWHAFILSEKAQVDCALEPDNREEYRDFDALIYDHDLVKLPNFLISLLFYLGIKYWVDDNFSFHMQVFFTLRLFHHGHKHWIHVVMDNKKQELQISDSLWNLNMYIYKIESMVCF